MFVLCVEMANSANTNTVVGRGSVAGGGFVQAASNSRPDRAGAGTAATPPASTSLQPPARGAAASRLGRRRPGRREAGVVGEPGAEARRGAPAAGRRRAPAGPGAAAGRLGRGERAVPALDPPAARRRRSGRGLASPTTPSPARPEPAWEKGLPREAVSKKNRRRKRPGENPPDPPRSTVNAVEGEWLLWGVNSEVFWRLCLEPSLGPFYVLLEKKKKRRRLKSTISVPSESVK